MKNGMTLFECVAINFTKKNEVVVDQEVVYDSWVFAFSKAEAEQTVRTELGDRSQKDTEILSRPFCTG